MTNPLSSFSPEGIDAFSRWLELGAKGPLPIDLLYDPTYSRPFGNVDIGQGKFETRYDLGSYLVQVLRPLDRRAIAFDRGLWTWIAAHFFDQLAPMRPDGSRTLRRPNAYILDRRFYYRHLARTPWFIVDMHGDTAGFLLVPMRKDETAPLSRQSYLLDQLASRQAVIGSPTLVAAARRLYSNPKTGVPTRGAGSKGRGSPRRLAIVANQLTLTYDIRHMPVERLLQLLPDEFST